MLAVIDIGSNTIRLVIYSNDGESPESMLNKKYAVGLAGYVDKSNLNGSCLSGRPLCVTAQTAGRSSHLSKSNAG